ncbi:MFS transporter [uncultured Amnibacterium sp.]|uniref:MFS transporter n=1 Tax=uncultured Amnibacterium sp. TaxID=1631851 RepID=UPI0035CC490D
MTPEPLLATPLLRRFGIAQVLSAVGDGAYLSTSAVFFTVGVGLPALQVGLGLTVAWSVGFLLAVPLGALTDRIGIRAACGAFAALVAAALATVPFVRGFVPFVAVVVVYAVGQTALTAARQAGVAALVAPEQRTAVRASLQVVQNVGIGLGAVVGSVVLALGTRPAFTVALLLDAAAFVVAAALLLAMPAAARPPAPRPVARSALVHDLRFLASAAVNAVLLLYMPLLSVVLPLWVVHATAAPPLTAALAFLLNTAGVVVLQGRVARRVRTVEDGGRAVRAGGLLLLPAVVLIGGAALVPQPWLATLLVLAGVAVETVAEVRFGAGSWALSFGLAPAGTEGRYQAAWNAGVPVARAVGPLLLTGAVLGAGPVGWLGLGLAFAAAGLAMPAVASRPTRP